MNRLRSVSPLLTPNKHRMSRRWYQSSLVAKHPAKIAYQQKAMPQVAPNKQQDQWTFLWNVETREDSPCQELNDAAIIHLHKTKGDRQSCDNHCGISFLFITGKILARMLLKRLQKHLEESLLPETQCGLKGQGHRGLWSSLLAK